ncbi:M56 family metallopeptidase [Antrihabitans sp. YC2-6]|uniref:M56 family metallopeptidase n=1 Tax=Antrihabitans sp. YC2-6 TaxID=2799498 RepID=UPI001F436FC7|nr:M56 family metallopeptidase [Antrihabitans sp. YC2-6]
MALTVVTPWLLTMALLAAVGRLERTLEPFTYVVAMTAASTVLSLATWTTLVALGAVVIVAAPPFALLAVGYALVALALSRVVVLSAHWRRVLSSRAVSRHFSDARADDDGVVVIEDPIPDAFAVRTGRGAVVITTGMKAALPPRELAAVIAHESAHVRYRHSTWIQIAESARALNPVVRPLTASIRLAAERHADECAAYLDRPAALRAVARASILPRAAVRMPAIGISSKGGDAVRRVQALAAPPIENQPKSLVVLIGAVAVVAALLWGALADVAQDSVFPEPGHSPTDVFR